MGGIVEVCSPVYRIIIIRENLTINRVRLR
jgi:hypothetical protein